MALVAVFALAVAAAPALGANERRQNAAIKKNTQAAKQLRTSLRNTRVATNTVLRTVSTAVQALQGDVAPLTTGLKAIQDQVPVVITALGSLRTGLETVATGLQATATGVQTLGAAVQAVEYGTVALFLTPAGAGGSCCRVVSATSSDVPDDGNTANVSNTFPLPLQVVASGGNPANGTVSAGSKLDLRAAMRSAEGDGKESGDPAGQVGGLLSLKCAGNGASPPGNCSAPDGMGGFAAVIPPGALVCTVGLTPPMAVTLPDGSTTNPNLKNIQRASGRTDQTKPSTDAGDPFTVNVLTGAPATGSGNGADGSCTLPGPGVYEVSVNVQFADIPTKSAPGPTD